MFNLDAAQKLGRKVNFNRPVRFFVKFKNFIGILRQNTERQDMLHVHYLVLLLTVRITHKKIFL